MEKISAYHEIQNRRHEANKLFDKEIKELQDSCPHTEITGWLEGWNSNQKLCKRCYKTVKYESKLILDW